MRGSGCGSGLTIVEAAIDAGLAGIGIEDTSGNPDKPIRDFDEAVARVKAAAKAAKEQRINSWKQTAARYESEPETQEGRKELAERAKSAKEHRNTSMAKYHNFEIASAALEIGIVLASASIITGMAVLAWIGGGLGIAGLGFMGIALFAPHAIHLF